MKTAYFRTAAALLAAAATPALAQVQPQYQPVQAQPAATQASVINLDSRIVSLERQLADILRAEEENGRRIAQLEAQLTQEREASAQRIAALEGKLASAPRRARRGRGNACNQAAPIGIRERVQAEAAPDRSRATRARSGRGSL